MPTVDLNVFKRCVKEGQSVSGLPILHKLLTTAIETGGDRQIKYTISTATPDRDNDVVSIDGWDLDAFMGNPVVLWGHRAGDLPIGKCVAIGVEDKALKAMVEFVPADMPVVGQLAEAVLRMSRTGFLSATSVGFRPLEWEWAKERDDDEDSWWPPINFLRQELMEFSVVSIPANPEALIDPAERLLSADQLAAAALETAERAALDAAAKVARFNHRRALLRAY